MATLQKFKFLATQCAVAGSPSRSPTASPVVHLRRRKTLRMLLGRTTSTKYNHHRREESPDRRTSSSDDDRSEQISARLKLKDLFVSSPPPIADSTKSIGESENRLNRGLRSDGALAVARRRGAAPIRPLSATLRQRLLRRAWRPALVAIPEVSP